MKRHLTYRYPLLLGILLLCSSLSACNPKTQSLIHWQNGSDIATNPSLNDANSTISPTGSNTDNASPTPTIPVKDLSAFLTVKGATVSIGDNVKDVERNFGMPNRIVDTEYDFDFYVYNNNYKKLVFIAISKDKVVGFYTDSIDFNFHDIKYGSSLTEVNNVLDTDYTMNEVLKYDANDYTLDVLIDTLDSKKATGIYVLASTVKPDDFTDTVDRNIELLVYDLSNSVRARNGEAVLSWSSSAAAASRKHSLDMAQNNYFNHNDLSGSTPGDRMNAEGISYRNCGENIIAGYGTAILSNHAWFNSQAHRRNMLNPNYRYIGVGFQYDKESKYKTYITQNYYR